jgi:hypothetical protein
MPDPSVALAEFVTYVGTHLTGDEKGEAADFLDHLFRALGHAGIKEAGATRETRVAKKGRDSKGKNYIDLLWPERVLFEMKSRGKKLERHYDQIFDYWTHIVPHRPPYVILCNFDDNGINPDNTVVVFPMADDYSFGVIQSLIHFAWFKARCSTLGGTFRYTSDTVFDTFPWPQTPTRTQIEAVAKEAVALNQTCAAKEAAGESITPPGLPLPVEEHAAFITEDSIRV